MKTTKNNDRKLMQKIFAIVEKETNEIVSFGLNAREVKEDWDTYYAGSEEEKTHKLQQTFMSQDQIRLNMF